MAEVFWHNLKVKEIERIQRTDLKNGLSEKEVEIRKREFGKNEIPEEKLPSNFSLFFSQFKHLFIIILLFAAFLSLIFHQFLDALAIFLVLLFNAALGFYQEKRAIKILAELKKILKIEAKVIREGREKILDAKELVPGDLILLSAGDKVPADARVIESQNLTANEMILTGEFWPSLKHTDVLPEDTPLADRENMVYMGTVIEEGRGKAIVLQTGQNTEIGKIAKLAQKEEKKLTPLQKKIKKFTIQVAILVLFVVLIVFIVGLQREEFRKNLFLLFETVVALAVSSIPEGLPIAITVTLALGAQRILKKQGLIRKLASVETLGSTTVICTDKTLTLTEGKMKIQKIVGDESLAIKFAFLCTEAFIENPEDPKEKWKIVGRPTEKAIFEKAIERGLNKKEYEKDLVYFLPFSPKYKFSLAIYKEKNQKNLYYLGAPEKLLEILDEKNEEKEKLKSELNSLLEEGYRVVGVGYFPAIEKEKILPEEISKLKLKFAGFLGISDTLRSGVKEAIKNCQKANILPVIVTGDHKLTAKAVAKDLGLEVEENNILEGKDLEKMEEKTLKEKIKEIKIFARVEPAHKAKIVSLFQEKGEIVAMTGDGVNDAPALRKADIGVALGSGSEVAKEASDLVLLNDSFEVIVDAVREGRRILDNVRKTILFMCVECFTEIIMVLGAFLANLPLPVLPIQILWKNFVEGSPQGMAFAFEPEEEDVMARKPENPKIPLLTKEILYLFLFGGILTDIILFLMFWFLYHQELAIEKLRTFCFAGFAFGSFCYAFSCKNFRKNLWEYNPFSNKVLNFTLLLGMLLLLSAIYLPQFQIFLKTHPLGFYEWKFLLLFGLINLFCFELIKFLIKKRS
jgi:P-type Ca2+ transporter type 2C